MKKVDNDMGKRFLVSGATGFVGSSIVRELVRQKKHVAIIVRNEKLNWRLADISSKVDIYESDILNPSLEQIVANIRPDYIFHLAAYGVLQHEDDPQKTIDINIKGTMNLLQAVQKNPFKLFINTGTSVEYGIKDAKMRESDVLEPINDYGVTKAAATLYCQKEAIRNKLPIVTLRLFTPYGYFEDKNRLIPSVILSALKNESIRVSVPTSVRDFVFIEDVIDAYLQATHTTFTPGEILNIGSGKQNTIENIVNTIMEITKSGSIIKWRVVRQQDRYIEPQKWEADNRKTRRILNWETKHTLAQGLKKTIQWFGENKGIYGKS